jgi:hypothetical protein
MMLVGDAADWLTHFRSLEERVVEAVEAVWPVCIAPLQARKAAMTHEDHITVHLVEALRRVKGFPGRIIPQYMLLAKGADAYVSEESNIDFVLTIGDDENIYLACECKRLNVPYMSGTRGLVGEYVDEGLMRFVSGQYSDGLPLAMMIGYVMNAKTDRARRGLGLAMRYRQSKINMRSARDEPVTAGRPIRFFTSHGCASGHDIVVTHTLLGWP